MAINERKIVHGPLAGLENGDGTVNTPECCGQKMKDVGDCGFGCCDDYDCLVCGKRVRVEWSD